MSDLTRRSLIGLAAFGAGAALTGLRPQTVSVAVDCGTPTPPTVRTFFGACPMKPGDSSGIAVLNRWESGAAARVFRNSFGTPPTDPRFGTVHTSFKPSIAAVSSGSLDATITATAKATPAGHSLEIWHESDHQIRLGTFTFAQIREAKNRFYRLVKAANPSVMVVNTVTGWFMDPKSGYDTSPWGTVNGDVLGIDCDGVRPTKLPYTSYAEETTAALAFIDRWANAGYRYFSVPEFGCPRVSADSSGAARAEWMAHYAELWRSSGRCLYACAFEFDSSPNYSLATAAEMSTWKGFVNG
jgi:hypothetical protein